MGGGGWVVVATNFSVSSRQGFKLWGLSPWQPSLADTCLTLAWASQLQCAVCSGFLTFHIAVWMRCQSVECIKFYIGDVVLRGKNRWINWICIIAIRTTLEIIGSVAKTIFHTNWENSCSFAWMRRTYWYKILNDGQPKLRASGVVVTLVCEYPREPEGIWGVFQPKLAISRGAVKHWCTVWPQSSSSPTVHRFSLATDVTNVKKFLPSLGIKLENSISCSASAWR